MASKAKPTGTSRTSSQAKKPATIDLDAKEVKAETTAAKKAADSKSPDFGRPGNNNKTSQAKTETKPAPKKADEKPASKAPTTPQAAKSSGSFFGKLTSAFMGGVAALVGFGAIGLWDGAHELPIIGNFYGGSGGSQSSSTITGELDSLKAEIAALKQSTSSQTVNLAPLNEKLSALETSIVEISGSTSGGTNQIEEKLAKLEQEFSAVNTSIAEITASAADGSNSSPVALSTAISALDKRLETMEAETGNLAKSVSKNPALDAINSSIGSLEEQLQGVTQTVTALKQTAKANADTLTGLTEQSATLEDTVASVKASEKVARSVAVNALGTALKNDDALSLPISSVKALIGETAETKRFEELNAKGIPSRKQLVSSLETLIAGVQNPNAPSKDGSISERFWANAQNMVSFRTSGSQEGDTPLAILSRVKAKIEVDDLSAASAEWDTLPADVRENGANWIALVKARIEAFALHDALNQKLTAEAG